MRAKDEKGPELQHPDRDPAVVGSLERGFSSIGSLTTATSFKRGQDQRVQQFLGVRVQPAIIHTGTSYLCNFVRMTLKNVTVGAWFTRSESGRNP